MTEAAPPGTAQPGAAQPGPARPGTQQPGTQQVGTQQAGAEQPGPAQVDVQVVRYSEQPAMWDALDGLSSQIWPEYNMHGDVVNQYWGRLYDEFADWQFAVVDAADGTVLAEGNSIPVAWDGTDEDLGPGIDAAIEGGFTLRAAGGQPTALCALAAKVLPAHQGRGLAPAVLRSMAGLGRQAGLRHLIAPVRPNRKEQYPTIPIERYAHWARADGSPFDPWVRVHTRLGARIGPAIPRSMRISGTVAEWESWTQMRFPETGDYVFPAGLATVHIDHEADRGLYWEPNVWIIHTLAGD